MSMSRVSAQTFPPSRLRFLRNWIMEAGLCARPGVDPSKWFPEPEPPRNATQQRRAYEQTAAALCASCKAIASCQLLAEAEEGQMLVQNGYPPHGIRGGEAPWVRLERINASLTASNNPKEEAA